MEGECIFVIEACNGFDRASFLEQGRGSLLDACGDSGEGGFDGELSRPVFPISIHSLLNVHTVYRDEATVLFFLF